MREKVELIFDELMKSFADWLAIVESSSGRLKANPKLSFIFSLITLSFISFSNNPLQLLLSIMLSLSLGLSATRNLGKHVKVAFIWSTFTSIIMVPRAIQVGLSAFIVPLRVSASVLTLGVLSETVGFRRLIGGLSRLLAPLLGKDLTVAFEIFLAQTSRYLRSLGRVFLAKASRAIDRKLIGEYSVISMAASELFFKGPSDAFRTSLAIGARFPSLELSNSSRDTVIFAMISFTYALPLIL